MSFIDKNSLKKSNLFGFIIILTTFIFATFPINTFARREYSETKKKGSRSFLQKLFRIGKKKDLKKTSNTVSTNPSKRKSRTNAATRKKSTNLIQKSTQKKVPPKLTFQKVNNEPEQERCRENILKFIASLNTEKNTAKIEKKTIPSFEKCKEDLSKVLSGLKCLWWTAESSSLYSAPTTKGAEIKINLKESSCKENTPFSIWVQKLIPAVTTFLNANNAPPKADMLSCFKELLESVQSEKKALEKAKKEYNEIPVFVNFKKLHNSLHGKPQVLFEEHFIYGLENHLNSLRDSIEKNSSQYDKLQHLNAVENLVGIPKTKIDTHTNLQFTRGTDA